MYSRSGPGFFLQERPERPLLTRWAQYLACRSDDDLCATPELKALLRGGVPQEYRQRVWRWMVRARTRTATQKHPQRYQQVGVEHLSTCGRWFLQCLLLINPAAVFPAVREESYVSSFGLQTDRAGPSPHPHHQSALLIPLQPRPAAAAARPIGLLLAGPCYWLLSGTQQVTVQSEQDHGTFGGGGQLGNSRFCVSLRLPVCPCVCPCVSMNVPVCLCVSLRVSLHVSLCVFACLSMSL